MAGVSGERVAAVSAPTVIVSLIIKEAVPGISQIHNKLFHYRCFTQVLMYSVNGYSTVGPYLHFYPQAQF